MESSDDGTYSLVIEAEREIPDLINYDVKDGVLALSVTKGFAMDRVVKLTLRLPGCVLKTVTICGKFSLAVAPGFSFDRFIIDSWIPDGT